MELSTMETKYVKTQTTPTSDFVTTTTPLSEGSPTFDSTGLDNERRECTASASYSTLRFKTPQMSSEDWAEYAAEYSASWVSHIAGSLELGTYPNSQTSSSMRDGLTGPSLRVAGHCGLSEERTNRVEPARDSKPDTDKH